MLILLTALLIFFISSTAFAVESGTLTVLPEAYEDIGYANADLIPVMQFGQWGLIDTSGKEILPFGFDLVLMPDNNGYTIAYSGTSAETWSDGTGTSFLFDKNGKTVWKSSTQYLYSCTEGIMLILEMSESNAGSETFTAIYRTIEGKEIKRVENAISATPFSEGYALINTITTNALEDYENSQDDALTLNVLSKNGSMYSQEPFDEYTGTSYPTHIMGAVSGGYYMTSYPGVNTYKLNKVGDDTFSAIDSGGIYWWYLNRKGIAVTNFRTVAVCENSEDTVDYFSGLPESDGLLYLYDFTNPVKDSNGGMKHEPISKGYLELWPNLNEKWHLISSDGVQWGYLSRDGKTEKIYEDAGYFLGGKSIIKNNGKIYAINDSLKKISNVLTGYSALCTLGDGIFSVWNNEYEYYITVYKP